MLLSGCVSVGGGTFKCSWTKPISISDQDQLSEATARQILIHNVAWEKFCG